MTRLLTCGFEANSTNELWATAPTGTVTIDATVKRTGSYSLKLAAGGVHQLVFPSTASVPYYCRAYFQVSGAPSSNSRLFSLNLPSSANLSVGVILLTTGQIQLGTDTGTGTFALRGSASVGTLSSATTWYRVELMAKDNGNSTVDAELYLDGVLVSTITGQSVTNSPAGFGALCFGGPTGVTSTYADDVAINDNVGSIAQFSYPGDGNVLLLRPVADSAVGPGWTTSGGAATGLWDNVDNTPPTGIADTTANAGHQIRNATSNASSDYDVSVTDYSTAGITAAATVAVVHPLVNTGAPSATSPKSCQFGMLSNPGGIFSASFTFYAGTVAGTYPTGWQWKQDVPTTNPTITLGTRPVVRFRQVTASTRIGIVDFVGVYVDYTVPAVVAQVYAPRRLGANYRR